MDLKLKGKSWAGNIYDRFESLCQDVDDFMSKDTVKFVENQVQSVGTSVKRFYSNVVQDIIPLSGDIVKPEAESVDCEQVETWDCVNSITSIRAQPNCINEKQLSLDHGSTDALRSSEVSFLTEHDPVMQFTEPLYADPPQQAETDLHLRDDGDAIIWKDKDNGLKDNIARNTMLLTINSSFCSQIFPGMSDEDNTNSTLIMASSPEFSAHEGELVSTKNEKMNCNHQKGKMGFPDNVQCCSISSSSGLSESKLPMVEDPENRSSSAPPVAASDNVDEGNNLLMDSPLPPTCDAAHRAMRKDRTPCDCESTKDKSFDVSNSVQSPEHVYSCILHVEEEMNVVSSTCPTPPKSSNLSESTYANFIEKAENIFSHAESNNVSMMSSTKEPCETNVVDMLPAFLILESNDSSELTSTSADNNAFSNDESDFIGGPSESRFEQHQKDFQSKTAMSPSKSGKTCEFEGDGDLNMETIDLNPDLNPDVRSAVLNVDSVHAASHRRRNFRYYKKLIRDAFTSRKRLSKEYEHLAILYGDIDMESSQNFELRSVSFSPNPSVHAVTTLLTRETCEAEWELL